MVLLLQHWCSGAGLIWREMAELSAGGGAIIRSGKTQQCDNHRHRHQYHDHHDQDQLDHHEDEMKC